MRLKKDADGICFLTRSQAETNGELARDIYDALQGTRLAGDAFSAFLDQYDLEQCELMQRKKNKHRKNKAGWGRGGGRQKQYK